MKTLILTLILVSATMGQTPDRWRGLIIDEATPLQAIESLGTPSEDKTDAFRVYKIDDWLTKDVREKKYRRLEFKGIKDFDKIILAFSNERLVFIELNPKKLDPDILENAYGVSFTATFSKLDGTFAGGSTERITGKPGPAKYPPFYYLYATSPKTFLVVGIGNTSFGSLIGSKSVNDGIGYPGNVKQLQIVSRTLENRDGIDMLK